VVGGDGLSGPKSTKAGRNPFGKVGNGLAEFFFILGKSLHHLKWPDLASQDLSAAFGGPGALPGRVKLEDLRKDRATRHMGAGQIPQAH
jgi:hypothetical protein